MIIGYYKKHKNPCEVINHTDDIHTHFHFIKHIYIYTNCWTYMTVNTSEFFKTKLHNLQSQTLC